MEAREVLPHISQIIGLLPPQAQRGQFLARFGLKKGMVFERTTGAHERICRFYSNSKGKKIKCQFEMPGSF